MERKKMYMNKRRKQAGMVLAAIMAAATLMTGCAEESSQDDTIVITSEETAVTSGTEEAAETLSGRVVSVTESVLIIESGGAPEGMQGETTEIPLTESTVFTDADGNSITYADLEEDSRVVVTLDEDGNALTVTIQGTDGTVYVKGSSSYTVTVENYAETIG